MQNSHLFVKKRLFQHSDFYQSGTEKHTLLLRPPNMSYECTFLSSSNNASVSSKVPNATEIGLAVLFACLAAMLNNLGVTLQKRAVAQARPSSSSSVSHSSVRLPPHMYYLAHPHLSTHQSLGPDAAAGGRHSSNKRVEQKRWEEEKEEETRCNGDSSCCCCSTRMLWFGAVCLLLAGASMDVGALLFGPESLVSPFGALTIPINFVTSHYVNGETASWFDVFCASIIVVGCILAAVGGPHENLFCTQNGVYAFFRAPPFIVYISMIGFFMFVELSVVALIESFRNSNGFLMTDDESSSMVGASRESSRFSNMEDGRRKKKRCRLRPLSLLRFIYPVLSAKFGSLAVLQTRAIGLLVMGPDAAHLDARIVGLVVGTLVAIILQFQFMNCALRENDSLFIVPVFTGTIILLNVIGGAVVYNELASLVLWQEILFPIGISTITLGMLVFTCIRRLEQSARHRHKS